MSYTYSASTGMAVRSSDGASVPWDAQHDRPLDMGGEAGSRWVADGSPASVPAAAPTAPPTVATPYQIASALNAQGAGPSAAFDAALVKAKPSDRNRWRARTDAAPADNPVLVRVCTIAGIDPVALIALAVQQ